jgi:hypothetical protein
MVGISREKGGVGVAAIGAPDGIGLIAASKKPARFVHGLY